MLRRLELARALGIRSVDGSSLWRGALVRACASGVAYDKLFVELVEREGVPPATFDEAVIRSFPRVARRPRRVLGR